MVVLDSGEKVGNPSFLAQDAKNLAKAQRRLAKKATRSKNRAKARRKVARIHARIADRRTDFLHKLSTRIIRENQTICVESLHVKAMVKHPTLAKAIHDVGWGEFVRQLEYKAAWYGRTLVAIDQWYPSSKRCSRLWACARLLSLDMRHWTCPACGAVHDRDVNAAKNILAAGLRGVRLWRGGKTGTGSPGLGWPRVKQESPGFSRGEGQHPFSPGAVSQRPAYRTSHQIGSASDTHITIGSTSDYGAQVATSLP